MWKAECIHLLRFCVAMGSVIFQVPGMCLDEQTMRDKLIKWHPDPLMRK